MGNESSIIPVERIERSILLIRGQKVMLDADLAMLYGVTTKRLNEQVRRNSGRFPEDFMLQLTPKEKANVVAKCDHLKRLKFSHSLPYAFTEQGIAMLSSVLNSTRAIQVNIEIMRAFVKLRRILSSNAELAKELEALEKKYDAKFRVVFDAIRKLMLPDEKKIKRIGF